MNIITLDKTQLVGKLPKFPYPVGGWVAGGAIRRWFTGRENLSDIDMFFSNQVSLDEYIKVLNKQDYKLVYDTPNALSFSNKEQIIQCIRIKFYPDIKSVLDSFDFTVCQFIWDGNDVHSTPEAIISVMRDHLGVHKIQKEFAVDSLRRAFKYAKKGFFPCNGTILKIANSISELTEQQIKDAVEISPNGGRRLIRID